MFIKLPNIPLSEKIQKCQEINFKTSLQFYEYVGGVLISECKWKKMRSEYLF